MAFNCYEHTVQYYETNKMGITHHSNYIRWMEEARIDFLAQIGWDFAKLEALGIVSPVISVECRYQIPTRFSETVKIRVSVEEFKGVKLKLGYVMQNGEDDVVCRGRSEHCFLDGNGRPIRMAREFPQLFQCLTELAGQESV